MDSYSLGAINDADRQRYNQGPLPERYYGNVNQSPAPQQAIDSSIIGRIEHPYDQFKQQMSQYAHPIDRLNQNWSSLKSSWNDPKEGLIGKGFDTLQAIKDPMGDWGGPIRQSQPTSQPLLDEHLGAPDENGRRKINDSGFKFIDSNAANGTPISDNSSVIQSAAHAGTGIPTIGHNAVSKGWVGRIVDNYLQTGSNTQYA